MTPSGYFEIMFAYVVSGIQYILASVPASRDHISPATIV